MMHQINIIFILSCMTNIVNWIVEERKDSPVLPHRNSPGEKSVSITRIAGKEPVKTVGTGFLVLIRLLCRHTGFFSGDVRRLLQKDARGEQGHKIVGQGLDVTP